jgi:hypothetical protein
MIPFLWLARRNESTPIANVYSTDGVPRDDADVHYPPRTWRTNLSLYSGTQFRKGGQALLDTCATFFYPSIFFVTILNGAVIAGGFAAGFSAAPALLVQPWS